MTYLVDANVLITAKNSYYPFDRVPEFWDWLVHQGNQGNIKIPVEIFEELKAGTDDLADWCKEDQVAEALKFDDDVDVDVLREVIDDGYAADLTDDEFEKLGRDPFLVAHAKSDPDEMTVVTTEVSKPGRVRANRHLPDVCNDLGVSCCDTFEMMAQLDFTTGWNS